MKKYRSATLCLVAVASGGLSGCDDVMKKNDTKQKSQVVKQNRVPVHRFVSTRELSLALDTQTGQLCRTWDWSLSGKQKFDADGNPVPRTYGEFTPTCLSVYEQYPSGVDAQGGAISDSAPN